MNSNNPIFDLAVVIINFRTPELTINCLASIHEDILKLNACIVLVDNHSADGSIDTIEKNAPDFGGKLLIYKSPFNGGFSSGNNLGISLIKANYYLLLNSDTIVRKDALSILLGAAQQNQQIGLLAPRLEWPDETPQESCFRFHSPLSELIAAAKTGLITKILSSFVVAQPVVNERRYYDWVSFACVLINASTINSIGLMDAGYFMYFEDVQFCSRAKKSDWLIAYEPSAHVVHLRGGSSPLKSQAKLRKRLPRYFYESRTRFYFQKYGTIGLLLANILWTLGWIISSLRKVFSSTYVPDVAEKQWQDIWINFLNPLTSFTHPDNYGKQA